MHVEGEDGALAASRLVKSFVKSTSRKRLLLSSISKYFFGGFEDFQGVTEQKFAFSRFSGFPARRLSRGSAPSRLRHSAIQPFRRISHFDPSQHISMCSDSPEDIIRELTGEAETCCGQLSLPANPAESARPISATIAPGEVVNFAKKGAAPT
jgi:hypothetical protein